MSQNWRKPTPTPAHDLRRGDTVEPRDIPGPVMQVVRMSDYDNGTVECLWFTPDQLVQRAWLPAEALRRVQAPRFRDRVGYQMPQWMRDIRTPGGLYTSNERYRK